ncbi:hypothetical protein MBLNU13_g10939t3 [Cladosporium sp. NU13]
MVQDQGIDVYLPPYNDDNKRFPEHKIPTTSPAFTGKLNEVYIEAVGGERFTIVVKVLEDFDTKGGKGFLFGFITGGKWHFSRHCHPVPTEVPCKTRTFPYCGSVSSETKKIDERWVESGFRFARLKMDEEIDMDEDQVAKGINVYGRVDVAIYRVQRLKIILRDQILIDLTDYPPPSPKVKRERGASSVGCKRAETYHGKRSVTQHATDRDSSENTSTILPAVTDKSASIDASKTREKQYRTAQSYARATGSRIGGKANGAGTETATP